MSPKAILRRQCKRAMRQLHEDREYRRDPKWKFCPNCGKPLEWS